MGSSVLPRYTDILPLWYGIDVEQRTLVDSALLLTCDKFQDFYYTSVDPESDAITVSAYVDENVLLGDNKSAGRGHIGSIPTSQKMNRFGGLRSPFVNMVLRNGTKIKLKLYASGGYVNFKHQEEEYLWINRYRPDESNATKEMLESSVLMRKGVAIAYFTPCYLSSDEVPLNNTSQDSDSSYPLNLNGSLGHLFLKCYHKYSNDDTTWADCGPCDILPAKIYKKYDNDATTELVVLTFLVVWTRVLRGELYRRRVRVPAGPY